MSWQLVAHPACTLGEGIVWSANRQAFLFVDIHGQRILQWDLARGHLREWHAPQRVGWLIPVADSPRYLAGFQEGFAWIDLDASETATPHWLARPFGVQRSLRLNDAKADAHGHVWAGSLNNDDESQPQGCLFRFDRDGHCAVMDEGYCVANGPALDERRGLMLHTDSARQTIYAFDLDAASGILRNKRVWRVFHADEGYPDGMNFDAQGHVWVAHWGTGLVSQFEVDSARLLQRFKLPVSNVTNLAFGGEALDRLFVTSARAGLSKAQQADEPLAGALFELRQHGATGLPTQSFQPAAGLIVS